MTSLALREFQRKLGASFIAVNGCEVPADYGNWLGEHSALRTSVAVMDLSFRGRICLTGTDRVRFLNGQVTNDVKALRTGRGCYAALVNAKAKMQSDLFIYALADELLLDLEPGCSTAVAERLEKYIIADDVRVLDASLHYGLLSVQGPKAAETVRQSGFAVDLASEPLTIARLQDAALGELYVVNHSRVGFGGFDLFVPNAALAMVADKLIGAAKSMGGGPCGWTALETARIEAGIPRFGADMDDNTLPPEAGIESRAISYTKGCYTGQEVIARIRTYGQVAKALRVLQLPDGAGPLPAHGEKLYHEGKEVGFVTSAAWSPTAQANIALGYVRKECNAPGTKLELRCPQAETKTVVIVPPIAAKA